MQNDQHEPPRLKKERKGKKNRPTHYCASLGASFYPVCMDFFLKKLKLELPPPMI